MFTQKDISILQGGYFDIVFLRDNSCKLQSKNTKHLWLLRESADGYYFMDHSHSIKSEFHHHGGYASVQDCLLEIADHDEFVLSHRHSKRTLLPNSFFDVVVEYYQANVQTFDSL